MTNRLRKRKRVHDPAHQSRTVVRFEESTRALPPCLSSVYDENPSDPMRAQSDAGATEMPPPHKSILLVDDDTEILESMRAVLENKGYRIMVARDGNAGLTVAERENPDLIVLDMMMPKKSGFLVLEKLKGRPGGLIPTIMITGNEGSRHRAYAEMLGVRDYIRKPFAMEKLVKSVEKILEGRVSSKEADLD
jgi:CheY-like chemotaxis protein